MSHDNRIAPTRDGVSSLSRLVFGSWRLLNGCVRPDSDQVARLVGTAVDLDKFRPCPNRFTLFGMML